MNAPESATSTVYPFDARGIGGRFRHAAVFGALEALQPGEGMRFVNDTIRWRCWRSCANATATRSGSITGNACPAAR